MMEKMVITHVNGRYIPFNSETRQVSFALDVSFIYRLRIEFESFDCSFLVVSYGMGLWGRARRAGKVGMEGGG